MSIQQNWEEVRSLMDNRGFLPRGIKCKSCGKVLNTDGGNPAESYLGTFTGICQKCESAPPFRVETLVSGAVLWSCPPHCPSWRRDRETYLQFPDCTCSNGREREGYGYGQHFKQCPRCSERHYAHPVIAAQEAAKAAKFQAYSLLLKEMDAEVRKRAKRLGIADGEVKATNPVVKKLMDDVVQENKERLGEAGMSV